MDQRDDRSNAAADALTNTAPSDPWDSWFEENGATDDFLAERDQPVEQRRGSF